ncbi:MAG TPA: hypothetical protein VIQ30_24165 [Pseudonocardia sp.]
MTTNTRRRPFRSVLLAVAARTTIAGLVTAAVAFSHHTVELSAYSASDQPGCVAAPIIQPGEDQVYYCDQYAVGDGPDRVADCLTAMGFHGRPDDRAETIYATAEQIEWCASDPAGMYRYAQRIEFGTWAA